MQTLLCSPKTTVLVHGPYLLGIIINQVGGRVPTKCLTDGDLSELLTLINDEESLVV